MHICKSAELTEGHLFVNLILQVQRRVSRAGYCCQCKCNESFYVHEIDLLLRFGNTSSKSTAVAFEQ